MRLAFASIRDSRDVGLWSGIPYFMARALRASGLEVDYIGPLRQRYQIAFKAKQWIYRELLHKRHYREWERPITRGYARQVREALSRLKPDAVLVPGTELPVLADLDLQIPAIAWCDVTFAQLVDYYPAGEVGDTRRPGFSNLSKETVLLSTEGERAVMRKCSLLVFTSHWAASSAVESYGVDPAKILVAPFGANFTTEVSRDDVGRMVSRRPRDECKLLFVGGDWKRKGGPHALEVAERLNSLGLRTTLTIVGCSPQISLPPFVKPWGYVNKGTAGGEETLRRLLEESHFVILPSIADCTPIAVSEGSSRGVPTLARATGAVGEVVYDGRNGKVFSPDADAGEWSAFVLGCFNDWQDYSALAASSFDEYQMRLNWRRNGDAVATAVRELMELPALHD